jgi:hypothetical protein
MVAVAVLLILLTMVGWIFSTATRASGTATGNNEIMGGGRAAEGKLLQDFNGLLKSGFIGIWYQLTPDPRFASGSGHYLRTDRMVFYTTGDHSTIRQMRDPKPVSTWGNVVKISPLNPSAPNTNTYQPITGSLARVFLGHSFATDPSNPKANSDPLTWMLARQARVISPELSSQTINTNINSALVNIANNLKYSDACEFELQMPVQWNALWQPVAANTALGNIFGAGAPGTWMSESQTAPYWRDTLTAGMACCGWMRRPTIDPATSTYSGTHMLFLPGCAEFKIQRWIERSPWTGAPLPPGQARWWPEEDLDGNGIPNEANTATGFDHSDFLPGGSIAVPGGTDIREYYNAPVPQPVGGGWGGWSPYYPFNASGPQAGAWFYHGEQDLPKAIKITVRLFDPNKRVADGQVLTMTFGMTGE